MVSQYYCKMIGTYHQEYFSQQQTYASLLGMCLLLDHENYIEYRYSYSWRQLIKRTWLFWNVIACIYRDANLRTGKGTWELLVGVIEHALRVYSAK